MNSESGIDYEREVDGRRYRFLWVGLDDVPIDRVRAFAFTEDGRMLLVSGMFGFEFPGGGLEADEDAANALARELWEEAWARPSRWERLGSYRIEHSDGVVEFHDYYWCRILLEEGWVPTAEISDRILVEPERFIDTLHWGWSDPKTSILLERALAVERSNVGRSA